MKKLLALLFSCAFIFAVSGCGGSGGSGSADGAPAPNTLGSKYQDPEDTPPPPPAEGEAPAAQ